MDLVIKRYMLHGKDWGSLKNHSVLIHAIKTHFSDDATYLPGTAGLSVQKAQIEDIFDDSWYSQLSRRKKISKAFEQFLRSHL